MGGVLAACAGILSLPPYLPIMSRKTEHSLGIPAAATSPPRLVIPPQPSNFQPPKLLFLMRAIRRLISWPACGDCFLAGRH